MRAIGVAATSVMVVLAIITTTAFSIVKIEGQPLGAYLRMVMLAGLGAPTPGLQAPPEPPPSMYCDQDTGECSYREEQ